jgi:hypothetical protein
VQDLVEYLRAYRDYISANLGWVAVARLVAIWLVGMCIPLALKALSTLPNWAASVWMIVWALLGYVFAPYGLWKHQRARNFNRAPQHRQQ